MYSFYTAEDFSAYEAKRDELLDILRRTRIPRILQSNLARRPDGRVDYVAQRGDVIGTIGRTMNFGFGNKRGKGYGPFVANGTHPELYKKIVEFTEVALPSDFVFHTITLNQNVKAKKHKDGQNVGESYIIGIGDYEGGKLRVFRDEINYVALGIKDNALKFNGAELAHETEDFTGERFTMIFYKHAEGGKRLDSKDL